MLISQLINVISIILWFLPQYEALLLQLIGYKRVFWIFNLFISIYTFKKGHIPTAIHFASTKDLSKALPEDKKTLIVAYCGGPGCSAYKRGASAAEKLGYTNVKHLSAGISGWKKAGADVEKAKKQKK